MRTVEGTVVLIEPSFVLCSAGHSHWFLESVGPNGLAKAGWLLTTSGDSLALAFYDGGHAGCIEAAGGTTVRTSRGEDRDTVRVGERWAFTVVPDSLYRPPTRVPVDSALVSTGPGQVLEGFIDAPAYWRVEQGRRVVP